MERQQLIKKYIEFFKTKNHKEIPNKSLIPENDPTALFISAGMHPLVPYLLGEKHPLGKRVVNIQRCIRTTDIEEVGDETHHTFFEMLGNWSFGDYFKKLAIEWSFEFLTQHLNIPKKRLAVSVFKGDENAPKDKESAEIWENLGISKKRIVYLDKNENWWGPAGQTGPCGPDTEMFYWKLNNTPAPEIFDPEDDNWVEIWNDVLMQYIKDFQGNYKEASQKNVDTGMGLERMIAVLNGFEDNYLTEIWQPIIKKIEKLSKKNYKDSEEIKKATRIIADHVKASVFIIADGIKPSNTEQGYILRRLIRRAIRYCRFLNLKNSIIEIAKPVFEIYDDYEILKNNKKNILKTLEIEEEKFAKTLEKGLNRFNKIAKKKKEINGKDAFLLYQSFGFPIEMTKELAQEKKIKVKEKEFEKEFEKHQKLSRTAAEGRFKSGLADNSVKTTKLHTATHLLNQALREVLNKKDIFQKGSNITSERLRFDFNFDRKLEKSELEEIENWINDKIKKALPVICKEMTLEQANKIGAFGVFDSKYGEKIKVYFIGNPKNVISKEICAGPHIKNTKELGHFKIKKQESVGAGIRRIKAILE